MLGFDMFHWMDPFEIFYSDSRRQNNNIYGVELDKLMFSSSRNDFHKKVVSNKYNRIYIKSTK